MGRKRIKTTPNWNGFPESESDRQEIKASIEATYPSFAAIANERGQIDDIFNELHEKYGMPRRMFNFLAKSNYDASAEATLDKGEELKNAWLEYQSIQSR